MKVENFLPVSKLVVPAIELAVILIGPKLLSRTPDDSYHLAFGGFEYNISSRENLEEAIQILSQTTKSVRQIKMNDFIKYDFESWKKFFTNNPLKRFTFKPLENAAKTLWHKLIFCLPPVTPFRGPKPLAATRLASKGTK